MHQVMEFILPILSASGEAVIMVLILVVLFIIGRGRIQPSEKTLFIERPDQYTMTLAPGLNLAQPFIEAVAKQMRSRETAGHETSTQYFEVRDKDIATPGRTAYLLAISAHGGMLHFEAGRLPHPAEPSQTHSPSASIVDPLEANIADAVRAAAGAWGIAISRVSEAGPLAPALR